MLWTAAYSMLAPPDTRPNFSPLHLPTCPPAYNMRIGIPGTVQPYNYCSMLLDTLAPPKQLDMVSSSLLRWQSTGNATNERVYLLVAYSSFVGCRWWTPQLIRKLHKSRTLKAEKPTQQLLLLMQLFPAGVNAQPRSVVPFSASLPLPLHALDTPPLACRTACEHVVVQLQEVM